MQKAHSSRWTSADADQLYEINRWSDGYFSPGDNGAIWVHPDRNPENGFDLRALLDQLKTRGVSLPVLVRFSGILKNRIEGIHRAFANAIDEHSYQGNYACVYPIKVNQQRQVVEEIIRFGKPYGFGLEAGSKPELLAVLALADDDTPIICNGFKDKSYIQMALIAHKMGRRVIPVVERFAELTAIAKYAEELQITPEIGVRAKLTTRGAGRWKTSTGPLSKFGLSSRELIDAIAFLKERDLVGGLKMLHFHLGSQITNIRRVQDALVEAARTWVSIRQMGVELDTLNVGGGLGVDYDGSQTDFESSMNYSLDEYAANVIHQVQSVCDDAGVPHPNLVSESGRAVVAHHCMLAVEVVGRTSRRTGAAPIEVTKESSQPLQNLQYALANANERNLQETWHDAQQSLEMAAALFNTGGLSLSERAAVEHLYWAICERIEALAAEVDEPPEEIAGLKKLLAETAFCNVSIFQSLPDSWAIKQLFPITPLQRLHERPNRRAILADMTCDSDGKIDRFIARREVRKTLPIHHDDGNPYYLGAFLTGAYQEILGDLHNLFGDTNAVHVECDDQGNPTIDTVIPGETVAEVLSYVQYDRRELVRRMQAAVERAVKRGAICDTEAGKTLRLYERGLRNSTYLS